MSLKIRTLNYLKSWYDISPDKFINGGELERKALELGFKASNVSRRCREMCEEGKLERRMEGKSVAYRYRPFEQRYDQTL